MCNPISWQELARKYENKFSSAPVLLRHFLCCLHKCMNQSNEIFVQMWGLGAGLGRLN